MAVFSVLAFAFWHSGGRAGAVCERHVFVSSGSLSLWPPGARCEFGEPAMHDTYFNPWFVMSVFGAAVLLAAAAGLTGRLED